MIEADGRLRLARISCSHWQDIMCQRFFDPKKSSIELWKTTKFRDFNYYVLEELSLLKKLALVKSFKNVPKSVAETIRQTNVVRKRGSTFIFPDEEDFKKTKRVTWFYSLATREFVAPAEDARVSTRDYKAEYARRIATGSARGISRSQARGHPKVAETPVRSARRPLEDARIQLALRTHCSANVLAYRASRDHGTTAWVAVPDAAAATRRVVRRSSRRKAAPATPRYQSTT
jgi:hypothetical protein